MKMRNDAKPTARGCPRGGPREAEVQKSILAALSRMGFLVVTSPRGFGPAALILGSVRSGGAPMRGVVWRQNVGAAVSTHLGKRRFTRFGVPGLPDIAGILADGRSLAIEVKREGGKRSEAQRAFNDVATALGAVSICVSSVESLMDELRAILPIPADRP